MKIQNGNGIDLFNKTFYYSISNHEYYGTNNNIYNRI